MFSTKCCLEKLLEGLLLEPPVLEGLQYSLGHSLGVVKNVWSDEELAEELQLLGSGVVDPKLREAFS